MKWHHHHDHERRIVFCGDTDPDDCASEYEGPVCDGAPYGEAAVIYARCPYHLAIGALVVDIAGHQLTLVTDLVSR